MVIIIIREVYAMKNILAIAFILSIIELLVLIFLLNRSSKKLAEILRSMLMPAVVAVLANLVVVLAKTERAAMLGYSLFFVFIIWILYYVLTFAMEFTGHHVQKSLLLRGIALLIGLDNISMLLNIDFGHAFRCAPVIWGQNEVFYEIEPLTGLYFHLLLSYALAAGIFLFLVLKSVKAPALYRRKYFLTFTVVAILVTADIVWITAVRIVNITMAFLGIGAFLFYYLSIIYTTNNLLTSTISRVVQQMTDALLLYDGEGHCIYMNESAQYLFQLGPGDEEKAERLMKRWLSQPGVSQKRHYFLEEEYERRGRKLYLKVEYKRIEDVKGRFLGNYFSILDQTEQINRLIEEHYKATHDKLTGLYNREYFYEQAERRLKEHPEESFLMICSNIRSFKMVNDIFGMRTGDEVLIRIGDALRRRAAEGNVYGRLESDRFAMLLPRRIYREEVFREDLPEMLQLDDNVSHPIYVYVGVYEITDTTIPVSVMCDRAFMAINSIKGNFVNQVAYYDDKLRESVLQEQQLLRELEPAMRSGQFQIYLQPQITVSGEVHGAEALVRWLHPEKGLLAPGAFIEALEHNGTIFKLDQHIWELACRQLKRWRDEGYGDMYLSVNISPRDFYYLDVYRVFTELVQEYEIEPKNLKLEITETAMMMDLERQLELIQRLRSAGFVVEMDDFGSGYSSLNMLKDIRVDVLKVDMKFLGKTDDEERGRMILKHVIELSKDLGMPVITEGVETEEQVKYLTKIGCDIFQGYYFAKPMQVMEFEQRYMNRDI